MAKEVNIESHKLIQLTHLIARIRKKDEQSFRAFTKLYYKYDRRKPIIHSNRAKYWARVNVKYGSKLHVLECKMDRILDKQSDSNSRSFIRRFNFKGISWQT